MKDIPSSVAELFEQPDTWTQDAMARNADGSVVPCNHVTACKFCLLGAIDLVHGSDSDKQQEILYSIVGRLGLRSFVEIGRWNDVLFREKSEVLELCKELKI